MPAETYARAEDEGRGPEEDNGGRRVERGSLAAIASHPRLPIWERRLAIALISGIVITLIFNWRTGVSVAILAAISDTIYRSHTAVQERPTRTAAQRKTERNLEKLVSAGYLALNERAIPGSDEIIDHLVIGPTGIYAIDSEQWDKRMPVRVIGGRQLYVGPFSQKERLEHARWEARQATDLIHHALGDQVNVRPSLAVWGPKIPWDVLTVRDVDVFSAKALRKYLRKSIKAGRGSALDSNEIERIYAAAARVLPPRF